MKFGSYVHSSKILPKLNRLYNVNWQSVLPIPLAWLIIRKLTSHTDTDSALTWYPFLCHRWRTTLLCLPSSSPSRRLQKNWTSTHHHTKPSKCCKKDCQNRMLTNLQLTKLIEWSLVNLRFFMWDHVLNTLSYIWLSSNVRILTILFSFW